MKNWKDIRTETLNLGFESTKAYEKNKQAYVDAYNWRQSLIASTIGGVLAEMVMACGERDNIQTFDLKEMAEMNDEEFVGLAESGVCNLTTGESVDVYVTDNRFLHVPPETEGMFKVMFYTMPKRIDVSSPDSTECELPLKWANIMPYLMANRLYLDDDASKAGYYWNLYVEMKDAILRQENTPSIYVEGGIDIDRWCY